MQSMKTGHSWPNIVALEPGLLKIGKCMLSSKLSSVQKTGTWGTQGLGQLVRCTYRNGLGWEPCILGLPHFPLPSSIVIRMRLLIRQSNLPACLAWAKVQQDENTTWHLCQRTGGTDRWNGCNQYQVERFMISSGATWMETFSHF